ncbi:unnamed protein product [marine sediment metagenome]|uniref:Uncharacterized protein n=1 Tax=marine sediment metagenome TaxID=412755 RepID=X1V9M7_9ZZZZ
MYRIDKLFFIIGPILILIGTFFIWYFDKKKIKTNPLIGLYKIASFLTKNYPKEEIVRHEKLYYPHNKKMNNRILIGWILIIVGTGMLVIAALQS